MPKLLTCEQISEKHEGQHHNLCILQLTHFLRQESNCSVRLNDFGGPDIPESLLQGKMPYTDKLRPIQHGNVQKRKTLLHCAGSNI